MDINSVTPKNNNPYLEGINKDHNHAVVREEQKDAAGLIERIEAEVPDPDFLNIQLDEDMAPDFMLDKKKSARQKYIRDQYQKIESGDFNTKSDSDSNANIYSSLTPESAASLLARLSIEFSILQRREAREFARQEREVRISLLKQAANTHREEAKKLRTAAMVQLTFGVVAGAISVSGGVYGMRSASRAAVKGSEANKLDMQINKLENPKPQALQKVGNTNTQGSQQQSKISPDASQSTGNKFKQKIDVEVDGQKKIKQDNKAKFDDTDDSTNKTVNPIKDEKANLDLAYKKKEFEVQEKKLDSYSRSAPIIAQGVSEIFKSFSSFTDTWLAADRKIIEAQRAEIMADAEYADKNDQEAQDFAQRMQEHATSMLEYLNRHLQAQVIRIHA
jgi:hypothetical protein